MSLEVKLNFQFECKSLRIKTEKKEHTSISVAVINNNPV